MKKLCIYISIFIGSCFVMLALSKNINYKIMKAYIPSVIDELHSIFDTKKSFYIEGKLMAIYLYNSRDSFELDGIHYDSFSNTQYNQVKDCTYKVVRSMDNLNKFIIVNDSYNGPLELNAIKRAGKAILLKNFLVNAITILIGILLYCIYNMKQATDII